MRRVLFYAIFLWTSYLPALDYGLFAKHQGGPIKRLVILAERCSGSNYTESLILNNCAKLEMDRSIHKHFPPWVWKERKTDSTLFVVVFRNPYDWLRSLHRFPHHAARSLCNIPFSQFIRSKWALNSHDPIIMLLGDPAVDRHPLTGLPFKNVMALRTAKIKTMLQIRRKVKNIYYVNYETARDYPQEMLQELQKIFKLQAASTYQPVIHYKAEPLAAIYSPRQYDPISKEDLSHINVHLNTRLEKKIGYRLVADPQKIP